ncbi:MAG TPA: hypothetical protein VIV11_39145 [Kofleriaceae bacterium]
MWLRFGLCALLVGCGPAVKPASPPGEPDPITKQVRPTKVDPTGRRIVLGEMCPQGAGGRPAVAPLIMRGVGWTDTASEVAATVERGQVPRFSVFGVDGKAAGTFEALGMVEVGIAQPVATGTYVGASPCTYGVGLREADKAGSGAKPADTRAEEPKCGSATRGCGIAVGEITAPDDPPHTVTFTTGGACISGNEIAVDIDGDGKIESFPIAGALDGIRAPAAEWSASPTATATCKPTYQVYDMKLAPEARPKHPAEKAMVIVDVLGVIDLDADGRRELILAMRFPTVRSIVVYTSTSSPQRLELAGEATGFAK